MTEPMTLAPESVEAVARRVAELLAGETVIHAERTELVDPSEIARRFSVSRDWVYEHATELGAIRLGAGPKARLRFDPERVADALTPRPSPVTDPHRPRRSQRKPSSTDLLPIGRKR